MYEFNEKALRKGINFGLGSQGIWTPELEEIMFNEITNEALRIHNVVGQSEQLKAISDLQDFAFEVCPLHREDDLHDILSRI